MELMPTAPNDPRLDALLARWKERQQAGKTATPEEFCLEFPDLLEEFKLAITTVADLAPPLPPTEGMSDLDPHRTHLPVEPTQTPDVVALAGDVGRFRPVQFHAQGGLGEVHRAVDTELRREVALKSIRAPRANDAESRRRFIVEAEVTARLEHPGVVPVYGLVQDQQGRPYYAMRFIEGESLADAIQRHHQQSGENSLSLRQLLSRFISICNTMAYAHSRGVMHRDLKPANIMLGKYGETLVVDWGLAKVNATLHAGSATSPAAGAAPSAVALTPQTVGIGTPEYMSPEQAVGPSALIDTRSDIYSLGAILHVVLTGVPPFDRRDPQFLPKLLRGDAPRPSHVNETAPQPLEAICRKAMAVKPELRYATATDLAADVERWLADEAVTAWREPLGAWARRWMRRRIRFVGAVAASLAIATIILAASVVAIRQAWKDTEQARIEENRQRTVADTRFRDAREAVEKYFTRVSTLRLPGQPRTEKLQRELLEIARDYYARFIVEHGNDPTLRLDLARSHARLAAIISDVDSGTKAIPSLEQALAIYEELARAEPGNLDLQRDIAFTVGSLANIHLQSRDLEQAEALMVRARDVAQSLAQQDPQSGQFLRDAAASHGNLANLYKLTGRMSDAEQAHRECRDRFAHLVREFPNDQDYQSQNIQAVYNSGVFYREIGQPAAGEEHHRRAAELSDELLKRTDLLPEPKNACAASYLGLGGICGEKGDLPQAAAAFGQAIQVLEALVRDHPDRVENYMFLAAAYKNAGLCHARTARPDLAGEMYRGAVRTAQRAVNVDPHSIPFKGTLARSLNSLGTWHNDAGEQREAQDCYRQAISVQQDLRQRQPNRIEPLLDWGSTVGNLANSIKADGRAAESLVEYDQAAKLLAEARQQQPNSPHARDFLRNAHWGKAEALDALSRHTEAVAEWEQAMALDTGEYGQLLQAGRAASLCLATLQGHPAAWFLGGWPPLRLPQ